MKHYIKPAVLFCGLLCLLSAFSIAVANTDPGMPPRPIPPATETPIPTQTPQEEIFYGSKLRLEMPSTFVEQSAWTVVQWQDSKNRWHDVSGWSGHPTWHQPTQTWVVEWWVARKNFGEGPFRWVVYQDATKRQQILVSTPFELMKQNRQDQTVEMQD
ncbi:MAG: hypothetical protein AAGD96_13415 [Chloroflexota bacterium]